MQTGENGWKFNVDNDMMKFGSSPLFGVLWHCLNYKDYKRLNRFFFKLHT